MRVTTHLFICVLACLFSTANPASMARANDPGHAKAARPPVKVSLPGRAATKGFEGAGSFSFAGAVVDGAAPNVLTWTRVGTQPVNRVELFIEYTAFAPSYTSELAIRIQHAASGFDVLIGGNDGCAAFGPCDFRPPWPAAPGTVTGAFSFDPIIFDGSGDWTITLRDSFDDAGPDGQFVTALVTASLIESEPNDDFANAVMLDCDDARLAQINPAADVDFYVVDGTPGAVLRIDIDANELGSPLDSLLRSYRGDMTFITENDDAAAPGEPASLDSFLQVLFPADGRVFMSVASLSGASDGFYRLATRCPPVLDGFEPNDVPADATETSCNTVLHAHIEGAGDVDYYTVSALPGDTLTVDVDSAAFGSLDPVLGAFDGALNPIGVSDDDPGPGEPPTLESYLDVLVPPDGTVILAVTSYDDFDFDGISDLGRLQSTGPYTLELSGMCATPDWGIADSDGDSIPDNVDNCTDLANPDQSDVDGDGFGNRCDPDFDNSGRVNFTDLEQMRAGFFGTNPLLDLNSDGAVNFQDLNIMRSFFFGPPGPSAADRDEDGDGWDDGQDFCVSTPAGANIVPPGCSLLEVVQQPELFAAPLSADLASLNNELLTLGTGDLPAVSAGLEQLLTSFFDALRSVKNGQLCEGRDLLSVGVADYYQPALALLAEYATDVQQNIAPLPPSQEPVDGGGVESNLLTLLAWQNELARLGARLGELESLYDNLCVQGAPLIAAAVTIAAFDDALGRFTDTGGGVYAFGAEFDTAQLYRPGAEVLVSGTDFGDGTYIVSDLSLMAFEPPMIAPPNPCLRLRIAPRQPMTPFHPGPYELLSLDGYTTSIGDLHLEKDQRLAVVDTGCPPYSVSGLLRHSVKIRMNYFDELSVPRWKIIAHDLTATDPPAALPVSISSSLANLTVEHRVQVCDTEGENCGDPLLYETDAHSVRVYDRGSRCSVQFEDTLFALPDTDPITIFPATTSVNQVDLFETTDPGSFELFLARGYPVVPVSSYPNELPVVSNQDFAVYNFDAYSKLENLIGASELTGVQRPSPLTWPSVLAVRNGKVFRYSCDTPAITRDVVSFCLFDPAFYRFPFTGPHVVTQGNFGGFSHNTAGFEHAWDIAMDNNTPLRAARGGRVIEAVESGSTACPSAPSTCVGNRVQIRHADGSVGNYFHINFNGALVNVGDKVRRGQVIAYSDNTGFSTGPHLHFEVLNETRTGTVASRFTGSVGIPSSPVSCYVPVYGDVIWGH